MAGGERNDDTLAAPAANLGCPDNGVRRIVSALHDRVGAKVFHELERSILVEHRHRVDGLETREHIGTLGFGADRSIGALQPPNAGIAVEADDEGIPTGARGTEDIEMAGMEQVEYTIGKDDASALPAAPLAGAIPVEDLARGIKGCQKLLSTRGWKWISRTYNGSSTRS